jgi:hypothetical protein
MPIIYIPRRRSGKRNINYGTFIEKEDQKWRTIWKAI